MGEGRRVTRAPRASSDWSEPRNRGPIRAASKSGHRASERCLFEPAEPDHGWASARLGATIAWVRFRFHAMQASVHSQDAASRPRRENRRKPEVSLMFQDTVTLRRA